ncbi:protein lethal(2)denticleless [Chelonus insularis]|uniref:protein lethal(2)denticleless n=1 Tax=Chelonus insularis TaxID=460826 RepID=UPI0015897C87|nr:protein lethal(2)denticleless [Chelonus insularis]
MNIVDSLIRQITGFELVHDYDVALHRLKCNYCDVYRGITVNRNNQDFQGDPLVCAFSFCTSAGSEDVLALASEDGNIALQDTSIKSDYPNCSVDGTQGHFNAIFDINWMPRDFKLLTGSSDHSVKLWDANSEIKLIDSFEGHTRSVRNVVFRPDDKSLFASGARDGAILFWDIRAKHTNQTKPDGCILNAHSIKSEKVRKHRGSIRQTNSSESITGLVFQDDYTLISCAAGGGFIKVWDMRKNYTIHKKQPLAKHVFKYHGNSTRNGFTSMVVCPSRITLYISCMDNIIYAYNLSSYDPKPIAEYYGHQNQSFFVRSCLSPDGRYLLSGSSDENAYIWRTSKPGGPIIKLSGHADEVTCVAWRPYGEPIIATCCDDTYHRIWRVGLEHEGMNDAIEIQGSAHPIASTSIVHQTKQESTPTTTELRNVRHHNTPLSDIIFDVTPVSHGSDADHSNLESPDSTTSGSSGKRTRAQMLAGGPWSDSKFKTILSPIEENSSPPTKRAYLEYRTPRRLFSPMSTKDLLPHRDYDLNEPTPSTSTSDDRQPFSPTMNLPNFVIDGTAPHLIPVSPIKSKENVDWLTKMRQMRFEKNMSQKQVESNNTITSPINQGTSARRNVRSKSVEVRRAKSPTVSMLKFLTRGPSHEKDNPQ